MHQPVLDCSQKNRERYQRPGAYNETTVSLLKLMVACGIWEVEEALEELKDLDYNMNQIHKWQETI